MGILDGFITGLFMLVSILVFNALVHELLILINLDSKYTYIVVRVLDLGVVLIALSFYPVIKTYIRISLRKR